MIGLHIFSEIQINHNQIFSIIGFLFGGTNVRERLFQLVFVYQKHLHG